MKHFELWMKDQIEERSSQLVRSLSSCEKKAFEEILSSAFKALLASFKVKFSFGFLNSRTRLLRLI